MITSAKIIYRYHCHGLGDNYHIERECNDKFNTIADLKSYFTLYPAAGYLIGYWKRGWRKPEVPWAIRAVLLLEWVDDQGMHTQEFRHVRDFAAYLVEHQALAAAVGFTPNQ